MFHSRKIFLKIFRWIPWDFYYFSDLNCQRHLLELIVINIFFFFHFYISRMVCTALDRKRRNMTISVTVLGFALATVFLAYFAFGDNENVPETSSIRFVSIVITHLELRAHCHTISICLFLCSYIVMGLEIWADFM